MVKSKKNCRVKQISKTRNERRKEMRLQKKRIKKDFFSKKKLNPHGGGETFPKTKYIYRSVDEDEINSDCDLSDNEINMKITKLKPTELEKPSTRKRQSISNGSLEADRFLEIQKREKKKQIELEKKARKKRIIQLQEANEDDDKIIRKLGKKLKIAKEQNETVHKMFNDGLGYALELCLPENIEKMYSAAKEAAQLNEVSENDFQEDLAMALDNDYVIKPKNISKSIGQAKKSYVLKQKKLKEIESKYFGNLESDLSGKDSELDDHDSKTESISKKYNVTIESDDNSDFDVINDDDVINEDHYKFSRNSEYVETKSNHSEENESAWEDIYGRKRDADGNIIELNNEKYLPPHLRARLEAESNNDPKRKEKLDRLRKRCKGFLNRLSESNMHKISSDIENLYMNHPRFDMNNTISQLILDALVAKVLTKERMILEHSMLIAILHTNVGSEVGAHFLETVIRLFVKHVQSINVLDVENKELDNIVFILAHLYTFKIFKHSLIFEIIHKIVQKFCEKSVECLLLLLRTIGFQLRKDDPTALKDLILSIQNQSNNPQLIMKENPRFKFMLEILNAIKNNNMNKIPQYDPELAEHLKKLLKSMFSNSKYITTLNITLEDLLKADEKGKWWVVGSAWSGNVKDIGSIKKIENNKTVEKFSEKLLKLAKNQRMNTNDRRSVFCIIMSAEDYVDAFERLLHLSLKDQRIISSIIIHCCLLEKLYNPYYEVLAQKFCDYDRKYQLAIQFAIWDRIKDIHSANKEQIKNLAQFLIFLIVQGTQPISILKVIEFSQLDRITLRLLRQIFLGILLGKEIECQQVFERIAPSTNLNNFKDSIKLFMNHFLLKGTNTNDISKEQLELLRQRISLADRILANADLKFRF